MDNQTVVVRIPFIWKTDATTFQEVLETEESNKSEWYIIRSRDFETLYIHCSLRKREKRFGQPNKHES